MVKTEYTIRANADKSLSVVKWQDGEPTATIYTVRGRTDCDCPGCSHHHTQCKHLKMIKEWKRLGRPASRMFFINKKGVQHYELET